MLTEPFLNLTGRRSTPLLRQSEASECALVCLAMVAGYHGLQTDLTALRRKRRRNPVLLTSAD
jgi:ATP-binding cassette subfamily B protein RaxB